jgi:hypothetical protein
MKFTYFFAVAALFLNLQLNAQTTTDNDACTTPDIDVAYYRLDREPVSSSTRAVAPIFNKTVTVPSGTVVTLETRERKFSDEVTVGTTLHFKVVFNVNVNGKVAVRTGAAALGVVKSVQNASYNNGAEITITLRHVQAVDDTMIPLQGDELTIRGQYGGEGTVLLPLQHLTATVSNNTQVDID